MKRNLIRYYANRAAEYEDIYQLPQRQKDLKQLAGILGQIFKGRDVLEIACGTGYWTQFIAHGAKSVYAIDCNQEVLEIARQKDYGSCNVVFSQSDAYLLSDVTSGYSGGFCGFWWSHIPLTMIEKFVRTFHSKLSKNALVVIIDNKYVEGISTPISRKDQDGNSYQIRQLKDGTKYEVLKNFPIESQLRNSLEKYSGNFEYLSLSYYWLIRYTVR